jgi:hypothetical protein
MSEPGVSEGYIAARSALLDALAALEQHLDALVLVGAQAIYVHTGTADVAIATHTKDGDVAVDPTALDSDPLIEDAMEAAGFALRADRTQPGEWVNENGVLVDLLVPETIGGAGRRGARIPPHSTMSARKVSGLEAALVDNAPREIASLHPEDHRQFTLRVAGPAGLLVAKLHKLGDRQATPRRLDNKDAHDVYRLLRSTDAVELSQTLATLLHDDRTAMQRPVPEYLRVVHRPDVRWVAHGGRRRTRRRKSRSGRGRVFRVDAGSSRGTRSLAVGGGPDRVCDTNRHRLGDPTQARSSAGRQPNERRGMNEKERRDAEELMNQLDDATLAESTLNGTQRRRLPTPLRVSRLDPRADWQHSVRGHSRHHIRDPPRPRRRCPLCLSRDLGTREHPRDTERNRRGESLIRLLAR